MFQGLLSLMTSKRGSGGAFSPITNTYTIGGTTATETVPTGTTSLVVTAWGGGADGGNSSVGEPGGGGGAYVQKTLTILSSDWGATINYHVADASAGGAGGPGSDSTVSKVLNSGTINIVAGGGAGGSEAGIGGVASGGDINTNGGNGNSTTGGNCPNGGAGAVAGAPSNPPGGGAGPGIANDTEGGAAGQTRFAWT